MSIIDNLVYDRTQADVDRVFTLKTKSSRKGFRAFPLRKRPSTWLA